MPRIKSGSPEDQGELSQADAQATGDVNQPNPVSAEMVRDEESSTDASSKSETGPSGRG